jgi:cell division protein FtsB
LYVAEKLDTSIQRMNDEQQDTSTGPAPPRRRHRRESAEDVRSARRRVTLWCLSVLLGVLVVSSLIGESGYLATLRAQKEERSLQTGLARIRLENVELQEEAGRLRNDPAALEEAARRQLGLIRPGETLVIVKAPRPGSTPRR